MQTSDPAAPETLLGELDFDLDPRTLASKYALQLEQLQARCDLVRLFAGVGIN